MLSPLGQLIDPIINAPFQLLFVGGLIDNGAAGIVGGTLAQANGAPGGILFGDGGAGATDAAVWVGPAAGPG